MITLRKSSERGHADHGWLESYHSFSFADYHDPNHMGVGNLRVINEDRIAPGSGFGTHGHRDMEIVSYVLAGALAHKDSLGTGADGSANSGVIQPGDWQRMSAGTGVRHSEYNHAPGVTTHFLQIWILPRLTGVGPAYEQKHFAVEQRRGRLRIVVAPDGKDGALSINADASIEAGLFDGDEALRKALSASRLTYVHLARGEIEVNGHSLGTGDAAVLDGETALELSQGKGAEVLVFDLARGG